jgi:hypothetical protein
MHAPLSALLLSLSHSSAGCAACVQVLSVCACIPPSTIGSSKLLQGLGSRWGESQLSLPQPPCMDTSTYRQADTETAMGQNSRCR